MATANPGHNQNTEKPRCPICLGKFKTPRQLPCLHSFCQKCLEDYISSKAAKVKELKECECPICRTMVPIPSKGTSSKMWASLFPIDSILKSIECTEKEEFERLCDCCLHDGMSITAHKFCVVCEEAMCENCLKVHQRLKAAKDHSIVTIEELTNNPKILLRFDKGFRCQDHEDEDLRFYCRDHKTACCASCCIVHHRSCGQVLDLRKNANSLLQEVKPFHVQEEMKTLENHLMNFEKRNDSDIVSLESQVQEMANKIKEIRTKIDNLLDDLERKVRSEGNQLYKQETIRKQEENHECQALLNAVRNSRVTLETVMKHGSDTQMFLMADRMMSQVTLYYEQIKGKFDETGTVILNLEVDPQIECVLAQISDIGRVKCRKARESLPISRGKKPLREYQIEMGNVVEIKGPDDKYPSYTGITYLQGDQVIVADRSNTRVFLLNSSYQYIASLKLPDKPWDTCVVDHQEVVVSLPTKKTLQFLSVTSGTIHATRNVRTRYECWGVASAGKGKIVVSGPCKDIYYWSLITSGGEEEKCHQFDCQCDPSSTCVALNSSCTCVYITVFLANSMYCFDMDGRRMYVYSPDSLWSPTGVATDRDDNVYVMERSNASIHQLTSDGTPIRTITAGIIKNPRAICFNNSLDIFLITHDNYPDAGKIYQFRFK